LREARNGLRVFVEANPKHAESLRLLSAAEETLLDYRHARLALERALSLLDAPDRRALKKLALLREQERAWKALGLSPEQLVALGQALDSELASKGCDHTPVRTRAWLNEATAHAEDILKAFQDRGGYCDCEILANVID
jgi:tetratricopeptide (TPR) repeat protein